jgi:type I restriction enzyme M protein
MSKKKKLGSVFDFACGSGSLILNVRKQMGEYGVSKIFAQEKNITTYNLARATQFFLFIHTWVLTIK